jgi:hypothetical protein
VAVLLGMSGKRRGIASVGILAFAAALAALREVGVAQDSEQPGLDVGAIAKRVDMVPRLEQGFLHKIVSALTVAAERYGKRAKIGHLAYEGVSQAF